MRKMPGHAVEMFAHGVVRSARPEHEDHSRLLIRINRQVHHLAIYEMIDFSNRNIVWRSHEVTYGFLQSPEPIRIVADGQARPKRLYATVQARDQGPVCCVSQRIELLRNTS